MPKKAKRPSARPGDSVILASHKSMIPAYDGKPFVGHEDMLRVSSVTGTGSAKNPYFVVVTDGRHFWHLEPDDVVLADPAAPRTKKSSKQLDAEIKAVLEGAGEGAVTIVIAWTEDTQEIAPGQKSWRHDLGERPKFVNVKKPYAAMWRNSGTSADVAKAREYIQKEHPETGRVIVYQVTEGDPLGRARRDIVAGRP